VIKLIYISVQLNCVELSNSLNKEKEKLQELQINIVSASGRGNEQRFQLWTVLQSDIKAAIKEILKDNEEYTDSLYLYFLSINYSMAFYYLSFYYSMAYYFACKIYYKI